MGRHSALPSVALLFPPPLAEGRFNPLKDNIMDFDALLERRLPQPFVKVAGEVDAGVHDPGTP
jgi:hypothetical protein